MYRHLLVPIDETELSTVTIGQAVEFARALGARITFFHVTANYTASIFGDAEVVRLTAPDEFAYAYEGRAQELLTKAESAARAQGVPCHSLSKSGDSPFDAIVATAVEADCDLIYMASHGRSSKLGMMIGSQTLKVLLNSEIPVLVSAIKDPPVPARAVGIIRDEHRSLAAVLHAWLHLMNDSLGGGATPDPALLRAMVYYIRKFPVALHHPKEEEYLFRKLRERTAEFNAELDELARQHERDEILVAELSDAVERYCDGSMTLAVVNDAVNRYARFIWEHLGREEGVIIPAAQRHLTEADWDEINAAFAENQDPRFGGDTDAEYRKLFSRIVNLASKTAANPSTN